MPNPADVPTNASAYEDVLDFVKELLPTNYIGGLILSNDADADHDVNITAGEARDFTDVESMRLASEITKRIDAAWVAGDDNGGIDAGAVGADTLYAVWLIKDTDGTVDALFSTSFTAPTMPGTYNRKRLLGAAKTDGGSDIIPFTQSGDYFRYTGDIVADIADATIVDETWEVGTLSVPPSCLAHVYGNLVNMTSDSEADGYLNIRTNGAADELTAAESFSGQQVAANFDNMTAVGMVLVDSSSQIQYAASEKGGDAAVNIRTIGFTMLTRREP